MLGGKLHPLSEIKVLHIFLKIINTFLKKRIIIIYASYCKLSKKLKNQIRF